MDWREGRHIEKHENRFADSETWGEGFNARDAKGGERKERKGREGGKVERRSAAGEWRGMRGERENERDVDGWWS